MKYVRSNLQTGSDFQQLVSTSPDCKLGQKSGQKSCSVFQLWINTQFSYLQEWQSNATTKLRLVDSQDSQPYFH